MSIELWTLAIAVVTALVCALCGSLLLVNRQSMVSEGLSHAVLPGLVVAFLVFRDYNSPWLILSAAASGMIMIWLTQWLQQTRLVDSDAGLGIVFAGMFSLGILIVSRFLRNTHFHADCIIDGNLALAPLDRFLWAGFDWGPRSWIIMLSLLLIVTTFVVVCFKELALTLFDPLLARRFQLRPRLLQFISLSIISLTTVAAFNVAGSVLIVALMIAPPAAAYLLTNRLSMLMLAACGLAAVSAVGGHFVAMSLDLSPTGPMASVAGMLFLCVFLLAPRRGLLGQLRQWNQQSSRLEEDLVLEIVSAAESCALPELAASLNWSHRRLQKAIRGLQCSGLVLLNNNRICCAASSATQPVPGQHAS